MHEQEMRVPTADGEMTTFAVRPEGDGPYPVAFVYMDAVGYREQLKENARRFAAGGYYCIAPDLYHRVGENVTFDPAELIAEGFKGPVAARLMSTVATVKPELVVGDTEAALAALAGDPAASAGPKVCIGYCMGARFSLHVASAMAADFAAAAGIHPGPLVTDAPDSPHHDVAAVRGELYFSFAEIDESVTAEMVDRFREELTRNGVAGTVERVLGVAHGFAMADIPVYDRDAAERHFERTLELWDRNVAYGFIPVGIASDLPYRGGP